MSQHVLNDLALVMTKLVMWSATRKASREDDLREIQDRLPPRQILSNGEIRLVDPSTMEWTARFRKRLERIIRKRGTRTEMGHFVPMRFVDEVRHELNVFKADFDEEVESFIQDLPENMRSWAGANPAWAHILERKAVNPGSVRKQFSFTFTFFIPQPVDQGDTGTLVRTISDSVISDVVGIVRPLWERSLAGKDRVTARTLATFDAVSEKLSSFSLLSPELVPVARMLEKTLAELPKTGTIAGSDFVALERAAVILSSPDLILSYESASAGTDAHAGEESVPPQKVPHPPHPRNDVDGKPFVLDPFNMF